MPRSDLKIDSEVALKLKRHCLDKYGTTHGTIKKTTEEAILAYLEIK